MECFNHTSKFISTIDATMSSCFVGKRVSENKNAVLISILCMRVCEKQTSEAMQMIRRAE